MLLCCSAKERAKPFVRDTERHRHRDTFQAVTGLESYNRQAGATEDRGAEVENSDLGSFLVNGIKEKCFLIYFLNVTPAHTIAGSEREKAEGRILVWIPDVRR